MLIRRLALLSLVLCVGLVATGCPQQPKPQPPREVTSKETAAPSAEEKAAAEEMAAAKKKAEEEKAAAEKKAAEEKAAAEKKATDEKAAAEKKAAEEKAAAEKKAADEKAAAEKKAAEEKAAAEKSAAQETKAVEKTVVFDGDQKGDNAKGWAVPEGKVTVASQDKEVRTNGKKTLEFHGAGNEWLGGGWNWFGWSSEDAGSDISKQKNLSFWAKVTGDKKPPELKIALGASDKTETEMEDMLTYCPDLMDGKWHEVVIPLKNLDVKNALNKVKVWDIRFGCWSQDDMNFSLFVDEIGFDNRPTK